MIGMVSLTLNDVLSATAGALVSGAPGMTLSSTTIDSRTARAGDLFFALKGPRHDGHDFLGEAFSRGAAAAVISSPGTPAPAGRGLVLVEDTTRALQELAGSVRRSRGVRVVGITGSGGKTTTKEMTAAGLATAMRVHRSPGNLNNAFGLPVALLTMPEGVDAAVLEMGMSYPGEMARLTEIARPDVGVILNVGEAHRANFASVEEIAAAKGELFRGMAPESTAVFNAADPRARRLGLAFPGRRISFAVDAEADLSVTGVEDDIVRGVRFTVRHEGAAPQRVALSLYGRHSAANAAAAIAVALAFGIDTARAVEALRGVGALPGRGAVERLAEGVVMSDETYNSNPDALRSVLASLAATRWEGRRVLACGDMLELGEGAPGRHREAGGVAARSGVDLLLAVGPLAAHTAAGARDGGLGAVQIYADSDEAARQGVGLLRAGDLVVVKGSRGIAMDRFAAAVRGRFAGGGER